MSITITITFAKILAGSLSFMRNLIHFSGQTKTSGICFTFGLNLVMRLGIKSYRVDRRLVTLFQLIGWPKVLAWLFNSGVDQTVQLSVEHRECLGAFDFRRLTFYRVALTA